MLSPLLFIVKYALRGLIHLKFHKGCIKSDAMISVKHFDTLLQLRQ